MSGAEWRGQILNDSARCALRHCALFWGTVGCGGSGVAGEFAVVRGIAQSVGMLLGCCWDVAGMLLGCCWDAGMLLGCWDVAGMALGCWDVAGMLGCCWDGSGSQPASQPINQPGGEGTTRAVKIYCKDLL